ncbi:MAG: NnrS family protein [Burkholderiales bacterium]|nr:NnrS family protein [Burkholderiales bacterium]
MNTSSLAQAPLSRVPLLFLGFRPFYLLAALFAALSVPWWLIQYRLALSGSYLAPMAWHGHEMLFGFAAAVIVGFLLTAVRAWTGLPTPTGAVLAALALLWVAGRILLLTGPALPAAVVDVAFLPACAVALWIPLQRTRNRNRFMVAILMLLALCNLAFHLATNGVLAGMPGHYLRAALYLVVFLVAMMAGRVVPSFTKNAVPSARIRPAPMLDRAAMIAIAAALIAGALNVEARSAGVLALIAAALHAARLWCWDPPSTRGRPILWILHLSYAWIPLGLLLLAAAQFGLVPELAALHAFAVGAIGGMIIGMITRTALGHTGRPLQAGRAETAAYVLVHVAALLRVFPLLIAPALYPSMLALSGAAWTLGFAVYLARYAPMLTTARADGRPG